MAFQSLSNKAITFNKGINKELSALELGASELSIADNFELVDGTYSGLKTVDGYERFDGTSLASSTDVSWNVEDNTLDDDADRIAVRDAIIEVPGVGPVLAVFEYKDKLWAIRQEASTLVNKLYYCDSNGDDSAGWGDSLTIGTAVGTPANKTGVYKYAIGRMQFTHENNKIVVLCNGTTNAFVLHMDDLGAATLTEIVSATLPAGYFPIIPEIWDQRLFLSFIEGNLFNSSPGIDLFGASDPFNTATYQGAGATYMESEITNLLVMPSALVVFCEDQIKALKVAPIATSSDPGYSIDTYSQRSGALWNTAQRILGMALYCDDRGISTLATAEAYGDFNAATITKKVQSVYLTIKESIIGAHVDREKNQYKVYTPTGGLIVTFKEKYETKGITTFSILDPIHCGFETSWIGGESGYVYKVWDGATSFDCEPIVTEFQTSYFTYNSPSRFKTFKRLLFEMQADRGSQVWIKVTFDYASSNTPSANEMLIDTSSAIDVSHWGSAEWGSFTWGSATEFQGYQYIAGIGTNMAIHVRTHHLYYTPTIFHNVQTTYSQRSFDF